MINKFTYLVFFLLISFTTMNTVYSQPMMNTDLCTPEFSSEVPVSNLDCGVTDKYRYLSVGVGPIVFIPNIGIGYRERFSQFGWDTALSFSTIGYAHQLSAHLVGHYYLNPCKQNSSYLGLGLLGSGIFTNHGKSKGTLSPDFVIGKELKREGNHRHFIEMHVAIPTLWMNAKHLCSAALPLMYVKYGFSF